ncbi:Cof-type HAD-IIB family hydrolase [Numidum massiliense]|uniref:Cof-type HAD-IIB family hydrolase n=1 Tax=Numidum massiliense TaxID=1522315 RepID=UPI001E501D9D|nr:Cof-type HAD-IIB family hydrolase [Numidum massiliense]
MRALQAAGVEVAFATGRAPKMFEHLMEELDIFSYVSCNGAYVVYDGKVVFARPLDERQLAALRRKADAHGDAMVFSDQDTLWTTDVDHPYVCAALESLCFEAELEKERRARSRNIYYALLFCAKGKARYLERFEAFKFIRWHDYALDVLTLHGSKAVGIAALLQHLRIGRERAVAFGDALNDVEMLRYVGTGIAMGNASEEAKRAADFVTRDVALDGIRYGLTRIGLL